jgi:GTPase
MRGRPVVAVVGRANVGKSTLVNRLAGRRRAIEHEEPGVTRDRQGYDVSWAGIPFTIVDTGGWEPRARGLAGKVRAQAERAAKEADLILFAVDAVVGITDDDLAVARGLRKSGAPVVVVANKADNQSVEDETSSLARLGFGEPIPVSALHGRNAGELLDAIAGRLAELEVTENDGPDAALAVAIVGRPNAGKSSLLNRLAGDERVIVDEVPGTTRDAVDTLIDAGGRHVRFVDTAGMRRRGSTATGPEYYGIVRSLRAIDEAHVVLMVVDATEGATEQDQRIARRVADAGRAAIIVLNKWDLVGPDTADELVEEVRERLAFVGWAPLLRVSAKTGRGLQRIMPAVEKAHGAWETRITTAQLNAWLPTALPKVPLGGGSRLPPRVHYATQAGVRPPHIVLFATSKLPAGPLRALERRLRESYELEGTPVRITVRERRRR